MRKKQGLLIDMGGTVLLPKPLPLRFIRENNLQSHSLQTQWKYLIYAIHTGMMKPHLVYGAEEGIKKLSAYYSLSLFSDAPEEFTLSCIEKTCLRDYFPQNLIIPQHIILESGKINPLSWEMAHKYLLKKNCKVLGFIEDERDTFEAASKTQLFEKKYLMRSDINNPMRLDKLSTLVGSINQMANHLLNNHK